MKRLLILLFVFLGYTSVGYSQVLKKIYFDAKDQLTNDSTQAVSYAIYGRVSGDEKYVVKKFDADGYLMLTGAFMDDSLKIADGKFVFYDWVSDVNTLDGTIPVQQGKERFVTITGNYVKGLKQGTWVSFYPDGKAKNVVNFKDDLFDGEFKSFNAKGVLTDSGLYSKGKKNGPWLRSGGKQVDTYENDKLISTVKKSRKELKAEELKAGKG